MSIDKRLSKMEHDRERTLDALTVRLVNWIQTQPKSAQCSIWRLVPFDGHAEAGISLDTKMWATAGRIEPDDDDRERAAEAFETFPAGLLDELEAAQQGSIKELQSWFCVADA